MTLFRVVIFGFFAYAVGIGTTTYIFLHHKSAEPSPSFILVQYKSDGSPAYCWQIRDGKPDIDLTTPHIRIKVAGEDFADAAKIINIDLDRCNGIYVPRAPALRVLRPGERP